MERPKSRRKGRKRVLDEEEYLQRLSSIVRRTYFPSPTDNDTPPETTSIDAFHNKYTSEDNASFERVLTTENERRRRVKAKIYGNPVLSLTAPAPVQLLEGPKAEGCSDAPVAINPEGTRFKVPFEINRQQHQKTQQEQRDTVELTPVIRPAQSQPIFTWGNVESTPQRVHMDTPYVPPPTPQRERHALRRLAADSSKRARRRTNQVDDRDSPFGGLLSTPRRR